MAGQRSCGHRRSSEEDNPSINAPTRAEDPVNSRSCTFRIMASTAGAAVFLQGIAEEAAAGEEQDDGRCEGKENERGLEDFDHTARWNVDDDQDRHDEREEPAHRGEPRV